MCNTKNVLFICTYNQVRSCTAESLLKSSPGYNVMSAGTSSSAQVTLTPSHLEWADMIFVMEEEHLHQLERIADGLLENKTVINLDVSFAASQSRDLTTLIKNRLAEHFTVLK
jgi:predicted protein tyrosine phosphatase